MSAPQIDPELLIAIRDMRQFYARFRKAKADMAKLNVSTEHDAYYAARAEAGDMHSIMHTRADRLTPSLDAFLIIMAADHALKAKLKRRPSIAQLGAALVNEAVAQAARASNAEEALKAATAEQAAAARASDAARQARLAITGYVG